MKERDVFSPGTALGDGIDPANGCEAIIDDDPSDPNPDVSVSPSESDPDIPKSGVDVGDELNSDIVAAN
jgi:hypothetical protein